MCRPRAGRAVVTSPPAADGSIRRHWDRNGNAPSPTKPCAGRRQLDVELKRDRRPSPARIRRRSTRTRSLPAPAVAAWPPYPELMIPPTRPSRPHRRADTFAFGSGETWRPLRLVLDDETLAAAESTELLAVGHYAEVELLRTAPH